jgi:hypothetical protein
VKDGSSEGKKERNRLSDSLTVRLADCPTVFPIRVHRRLFAVKDRSNCEIVRLSAQAGPASEEGMKSTSVGT